MFSGHKVNSIGVKVEYNSPNNNKMVKEKIENLTEVQIVLYYFASFFPFT
jgi:hypothetical protein